MSEEIAMKKVIVTGASGFIGKNLILNLPEDWETVALYNRSVDFPDFVSSHAVENCIPAKCDLTDHQAVINTAKRVGKDFDICIYLAANGNPSLSVGNPKNDLQTNAIGLIYFIENFSIQRFIYMSSGAVYDGLQGDVSPETAVQPKLPYAISKLASEQYLRFFSDKECIDEYVILRFFGAYGPFEPSRKIYTRLVNAFFFEGKNSFTVRGDGQNYIDAMFVDDAIDCLLRVVQGNVKNKTFDFCMGFPITIDGLIRIAASTFGKLDIRIEHVGRTTEPIRFMAIQMILHQPFSFISVTGLPEGLLKLRDHLANERK